MIKNQRCTGKCENSLSRGEHGLESLAGLNSDAELPGIDDEMGRYVQKTERTQTRF